MSCDSAVIQLSHHRQRQTCLLFKNPSPRFLCPRLVSSDSGARNRWKWGKPGRSVGNWDVPTSLLDSSFITTGWRHTDNKLRRLPSPRRSALSERLLIGQRGEFTGQSSPQLQSTRNIHVILHGCKRLLESLWIIVFETLTWRGLNTPVNHFG